MMAENNNKQNICLTVVRQYKTSRTRIFAMSKICTGQILRWPLYRGQKSNGGQSHVTCVGTPSGHPDDN